MNKRHQVGLFFALFFAYLLVGGREPPWNDARQIYQVASSLVRRGDIDVEARTFVVRDGRYYASHPLLASAVHLPGALLERAFDKSTPEVKRLVEPLACHLGPAALGALIGLLFFQLCLALGSSLSGARFGALLVSFGSMVAVYARSPYSEITQAAAFLAFYAAFLAWLERPTPRRALIFGLAAGALVNTKVVFLLALPGAVAIAAAVLVRASGWRTGGRRFLRHAGAALLGALPGIVLLFGYNYARTHTWFGTGYQSKELGGPEFGELTAVGVFGLFFSPGKSMFLYSPPLLVAALVLRRALRSRPWTWFAALCATAGPVVLFYGRFTFWHGDWCWGPRYLLFLIPPALVPVVFLYDDLRLRHRALAPWAAGAIFAAGFAVQVLGALFYWDHYIRIAREAKERWLGAANRTGATTPDTGNDCGPCFEDMYALNWTPPFQPIHGHWWLAKHKALGYPAVDAEGVAPWRRYTKLTLPVNSPYDRARADWWLLDWKGEHRKPGLLLFGWLALGALAGTAAALARPRLSFGRLPVARPLPGQPSSSQDPAAARAQKA